MDKSFPSSLIFFSSICFLFCLVSSATVSTVFLFGDSILDAGNNRFNENCSIQANFPPYGQDFFHHPTGRFTNGRTVSDFIAESLGIELQKPYLEVEMLVRSGKMKDYPANGPNFASAGSGVLKETNEMMTNKLAVVRRWKQGFFSSVSFLFCLVSSAIVSTVFLFGDSNLDAGNNRFNKNCSIQANFPPYGQDFFHHPTGRFTNGRTVGDFIAESLGIELQKPYLEVEMLVRSGKMKDYPAIGINFASAGSGVLNETNEIMGVIPLQVQLQQFESLVIGNKIDKKIIEQALYVFETGSNDIFFYFFPTDAQKPNPDDFVNIMLSEFERVVQRVYELGARRIAIFGLGPVGCIPARLNLPGAVAEQCFPQINEMVVKYNLGLEALVNEMPTKLHGAVGVYASTFDVVGLFLILPQRYGFINVSSACCGEGTLRGLSQCGTGQYELCKNPNQYVFWDYFHPSEHAYKLIFKAFWDGKAPRIRPLNLKNLVNLTLPLP